MAECGKYIIDALRCSDIDAGQAITHHITLCRYVRMHKSQPRSWEAALRAGMHMLGHDAETVLTLAARLPMSQHVSGPLNTTGTGSHRVDLRELWTHVSAAWKLAVHGTPQQIAGFLACQARSISALLMAP